MRVLFDHPFPFALTHGGFQIQIEQTMLALKKTGLDVEHVRWWDEFQKGDLIHFFGRPPEIYVNFAQNKGCKVIIADLNTELASRSALHRLAQRSLIKVVKYTLPAALTNRMGWQTFSRADALMVLTRWEAEVVASMFEAPKDKIYVVPNGVEEVFLNSVPLPRGKWLVCTSTVTNRKRVLELAFAAVAAETPVWIIGKPYSPSDPYAVRFEQLARKESKWIRYEGAITDRARLAAIYREARGFVLLSAMETLSLSALEASACECPMLLSDLPWARHVFGNSAAYCPIASPRRTAEKLREFYEKAPKMSPPPKPLTWGDVAMRIRAVYEEVLAKAT